MENSGSTQINLRFRPGPLLMKYPRITRDCQSCGRGKLFLIKLREYVLQEISVVYPATVIIEFMPVGKCTNCTNLILDPALEEALVELIDKLTIDLVTGRELIPEYANFRYNTSTFSRKT